MNTQTVDLSAIKAIPESAWAKLSQERILFGHQSVGTNIIKGIRDIINDNPQIKLNIIEHSHPSEIPTPGFIHFKLGKNTDPQSKIDEFFKIFKEEVDPKLDLAFFKFCYVDFSEKTDVVQVFNTYKKTMNTLALSFPQTKFIHVTVPLKAEPKNSNNWRTGAKIFIKRILNQPLDELIVNKQRNEFNELLKDTYSGKAPIFDLAAIEATFPDGKQQVFSNNGKKYLSLVSDYTNDGGHLNEIGRKVVAAKLLVFLTELL
ncbi:MAG TPA: hypothetical protein DEG17_06220 [Cyanobacteria bacterium UBA11149]|nr:hypothetical protein [Cyanobacteria bacterium UBA11367]HBE59641.1 hypothetical protein [Cyanobacteria bacterium UBA11366]HBR77091.1 hypothetical protein [Cyanobacteria bacterium UBA11159]HBS69059.1 hypothetical protein [Cyanobacteria bacterium UBA11153]HBW88472.1 hypothetical protein [Cyanobacteria bacterium UBA11149]HCA94800.1 hypothetical protein [Cyanobacteria bacterium UBA9226]